MDTKDKINYEPLRSEITDEALLQTDKHTKFQNYAGLHIKIAAVAWAALVVFGLLRSVTTQDADLVYKVTLFIAWALAMAVFGAIYLLFTWTRFHPYREGIKSDIRFKRFLEANPHVKVPAVGSRQPEQGSLLDKDGTNLSPERSIVISDKHASQNPNLRLTNYTDTASLGSFKKAEDEYCVISAELDAKELPHVYFKPVWKQRRRGRHTVPASYQKGQKMEISSEFDKYFETYVPEGSGRDVLYFLTPELMEQMIDLGNEFDMEIRNNMLFIYLRRHVTFSYDDLAHVLESVRLLQLEFSDNTEKYKRYPDGSEQGMLRTSIVGAMHQRKRNVSHNSYVIMAKIMLRMWRITAIGTLILFICILIAMAISTLL